MQWHHNKFRAGTKLILWTLLLVQILLIGGFWILQGTAISSFTEEDDGHGIYRNNEGFTIDFVKAFNYNKDSSSNNKLIKSNKDILDSLNYHKKKNNENYRDTTKKKEIIEKPIQIKSISNFSVDFLIFPDNSRQQQHHKMLKKYQNGPEYEDHQEAIKDGNLYMGNEIHNDSSYSNENTLACFREGTVIEDDLGTDPHNRKCSCKPEWHGKDCGQPEVIWRAFMTAKVPLAISNTARSVPHKLIYMITGNVFSLELLEIQIMELINTVDFFIICNKKSKRLKVNFLNSYNDRILIIEDGNLKSNHKKCSSKLIYEKFKLKLSSPPSSLPQSLASSSSKSNYTLGMEAIIRSDDIFIYSKNDEILNNRAIKYLKYYDNSLGVIRFRLKYNIYGFYWQHPESTIIGGVASTIGQLEDNFKSDPERLLLAKKTSIIIGDLNHIGGWYCKFCYQPNEIIERLQIEAATKISSGRRDLKRPKEDDNKVEFPKSIKSRQIDSKYIQNLIASGLYIDGKLGLNKLYRFSDKYYAPEYVEKNSWKFDNILVNLFLSFDEDDDETAYDN